MQQHDHRPVSRAFIDDIEHKLTAAVLVHALSMRPFLAHRMATARPVQQTEDLAINLGGASCRLSSARGRGEI